MRVADETYKEVDLHRDRPLVFGEGPVPARVMFVGEAPDGAEQDRGRPFVGDRGKLLNTALAEVGISRKDVYITNAVKHQPPKNRDPYIKEVKAYLPILQQEIDAVQPELVVLLGAVPAMPFFGKKSVVDRRGYITNGENNLGNWTTISTYHPAAFLHGNPLWPVFLADLRKAKAYLDGEYHESPTDVVVADSLQDAFDVLDRMAAAPIFSFDLETSGFSCKSDKILCWSFADEAGKAYVIPLQDVDNVIFEGDKLRALNSRLQEFLFTPNNPFVGWNHQFDLNFLYEQMGFENRGKLLDNWFADGMLMHHLLEEEMPHNLEYVAALHTSMPAWDGELKQYKKKHKIKTYRDIPGDILWSYAGTDADATLRLFYKFLPRLEDENLGDFYFDHQHHMAKVFSKMAYRGVPVDLEYLQGLRDSVSIELEDVMEKIFEAAGERFNPRSHKQKAVILYDKLGLPEVLPRTGANNRSTAKEAMQMLSDQHPVPKLFVRHSELNKMMTSYLGDSAKTIFSNIDEDGFCRTGWLLHGTETGRCSSASPNLTNIPRGGGFREAFKAPVGWKMIEADYSQAEFRYAAYRAGETEVIAMLDAGYDGHQASAAAVFNVSIDEVTPEQRSIGKTVNFLIQYGGGPGMLAKSAGVTYRKAELIIQKFFKKRQALVAHMREIGRQALDPDIRRIVNVYGRVRHMPVGFTKEARQHIIKEAVNFDPQGGVADTLWRSMILLDRWFEENEMLSYFIIALHDGLYILSPDDEVDAVVAMVEEIMTLPLPVIGAALPVDIKVGERWESKG